MSLRKQVLLLTPLGTLFSGYFIQETQNNMSSIYTANYFVNLFYWHKFREGGWKGETDGGKDQGKEEGVNEGSEGSIEGGRGCGLRESAMERGTNIVRD